MPSGWHSHENHGYSSTISFNENAWKQVHTKTSLGSLVFSSDIFIVRDKTLSFTAIWFGITVVFPDGSSMSPASQEYSTASSYTVSSYEKEISSIPNEMSHGLVPIVSPLISISSQILSQTCDIE